MLYANVCQKKYQMHESSPSNGLQNVGKVSLTNSFVEWEKRSLVLPYQSFPNALDLLPPLEHPLRIYITLPNTFQMRSRIHTYDFNARTDWCIWSMCFLDMLLTLKSLFSLGYMPWISLLIYVLQAVSLELVGSPTSCSFDDDCIGGNVTELVSTSCMDLILEAVSLWSLVVTCMINSLLWKM